MKEYKVVSCSSVHELNKTVNQLLNEGWTMIGSHKAVIVHSHNRFRGQQHMDTMNDIEYSQTMSKNRF